MIFQTWNEYIFQEDHSNTITGMSTDKNQINEAYRAKQQNTPSIQVQKVALVIHNTECEISDPLLFVNSSNFTIGVTRYFDQNKYAVW